MISSGNFICGVVLVIRIISSFFGSYLPLDFCALVILDVKDSTCGVTSISSSYTRFKLVSETLMFALLSFFCFEFF